MRQSDELTAKEQAQKTCKIIHMFSHEKKPFQEKSKRHTRNATTEDIGILFGCILILFVIMCYSMGKAHNNIDKLESKITILENKIENSTK